MGHFRENFTHIPPNEVYKGDHSSGYVHRLVVKGEGGEELAHADVKYKNEPFPFFYLEELYVPQQLRGKGFGSGLLEQFQSMLKEKGMAGLLRDAIDDDQPGSQGMYERHGWESSPWKTWKIYNRPERVSDDQIIRAIRSIRKSDARESKHKYTSASAA